MAMGKRERGARGGWGRRLLAAMVDALAAAQAGLVGLVLGARWLGGAQTELTRGAGYVLPWLFAPLLLIVPLAAWRRSRTTWGLTAVSLLAFLALFGERFVPRPAAAASAGPTFRIMTYNLRARNADPAGTLANILAQDADVVALHEYTTGLAAAFDAELAARYPYREVVPGRGFYSRLPIVAYDFVPMPGSMGGGAQRVVVDVNGREVTILSAHPKSPPTRSVRLRGVPVRVPTGFRGLEAHDANLATLLAEVEATEGPLLVVGDLNVTDQHPAYRALTARLRDAFVERETGFGFTFTPFDDWRVPTWRIDFVLHSPELTALAVEVGNFAGSDHKPVVATIGIAN